MRYSMGRKWERIDEGKKCSVEKLVQEQRVLYAAGAQRGIAISLHLPCFEINNTRHPFCPAYEVASLPSIKSCVT